MAGGAFRFLFSTLLDAGNPKFVVNAVRSATRVGVNIGDSTTNLRKRLDAGRLLLTLPLSRASYFHHGPWLSNGLNVRYGIDFRTAGMERQAVTVWPVTESREDDSLVSAARDGDRAAFGRLNDRYARMEIGRAHV